MPMVTSEARPTGSTIDHSPRRNEAPSTWAASISSKGTAGTSG